METVRITVFDNSRHFHDSMSVLFSAHPGLELVGSFHHLTHALEDIGKSDPDIVLMDIDMPGRTSITAVKSIREKFPHLPVIMLTSMEEDDMIYQSICAGAVGYLSKNKPHHHIVDSVHEVKNGGADAIHSSVAHKMMHHFENHVAKNHHPDYHLSQREKDVLGLLIKGLSLKMIADELFISRETVKTHIKKIYSKLHVSCATEAVAKTLKQHLLD